MDKPRPVCPFNAENCFAYVHRNKTCKALEDTNFKPWRGCPFYKSKEQLSEERKANGDPFHDFNLEEELFDD